MDNIIFTEHITRDDLVYLNQFILKQNKRITLNLISITLASLIGAIICLIQYINIKTSGYLVGTIIFGVLSIFIGVLVPLLLKSVIKNSIYRKMSVLETWNIYVEIDDEHIYYNFDNIDKNSYDPYVWGDIEKAYEYNDYFIIKINFNTVLILKKKDIENPEYLRELMVKHLITNIRFINKCK